MLVAYGLAITTLLLLPPQYWARWLTIVGAGLLLTVPYFLGVLVRHAMRQPSATSALLVAAIGVILLTSVLDLLRWLGFVPFSNASLSILAMPLLMLAFGALLVERQVRSIRAERQVADTLRLTVARQAEQLAASQAALESRQGHV